MSFRGIWHIAYKQAYHLDGMNRRLGSGDCTGAMCDPWPEKPLRIDAKVIARRGNKNNTEKGHLDVKMLVPKKPPWHYSSS